MMRFLKVSTFLFVMLLGLMLSGFSTNVFAQSECNSPSYAKTASNGKINWGQFPTFSLPFKIIYNGPRLGDSLQSPLKHGFSHLATFTQYDSQLARDKRALIWYGVASIAGQPWYEIESPWNNDLTVYKQKWASDMQSLATLFANPTSTKNPDVDLFVVDIERELPTDAAIRLLKNDALVPNQYKALTDLDFINRYKKDLSKLYAEPITYLKANEFPATTQIASYSDAPIKRSFYPLNYTWQEWQTSNLVLNYYMQDTLTNQVGGAFYNQNTFLTPSAYLCYENRGSKQYANIAYQLFQIEANKARTDKDLVLFEWLKYERCLPSTAYNYDVFVDDNIIEAQAIFPFFAGAKGIWLWDGAEDVKVNYAAYETFTNALYRLSQFKDFFTGNYRLFSPKTAYSNFQENGPLWRAVIKGNSILIAAINEFAEDSQTTDLVVSYGNWSQKITLQGKQTYLCSFSLPESANSYGVWANPNDGSFSFTNLNGKVLSGVLRVFDMMGREVYTAQQNAGLTYTNVSLTVPTGHYVVRYEEDGQVFSEKITVVR
ncbi:MAG: T9SS type A sorting domain-containing protein [Spirosomataceae bacterium]